MITNSQMTTFSIHPCSSGAFDGSGNRTDEFVQKRQSELEEYIRTILEVSIWLQRRSNVAALPHDLAEFLRFSELELHCVVESLARRINKLAEQEHISTKTEMSDKENHAFTPIQLWALTEKMKRPDQRLGPDVDVKSELDQVLEFFHNLSFCTITGKHENMEDSNVNMNQLPFGMHMFKALKSLQLLDVDPRMMGNLQSIQSTLECLRVTGSVSCLSDLLLEPGLSSPAPGRGSVTLPLWSSLTVLDLSHNSLTSIDSSVILLRVLKELNLSHNRLNSVDHLHHLPHLTDLDISHNEIEKVQDWHLRLGNVKCLHLRNNKIASLSGLRKLYSLEYLDIRDNCVQQTKDIWPVGQLPCLEKLLLQGNLIESSIEYRTRVFEAFGERACDVVLDGEPPSRRELDTVSVRLAIRQARDDRQRLLRRTNEEISRKLEGCPSSHPVGNSPPDILQGPKETDPTNQSHGDDTCIDQHQPVQSQ